MKLYSLLNENHVLIGEAVQTMEEALRRMVRAFGAAVAPDQVDPLVHSLLAREEQHPTVIDDRVCIPHMRMESLDVFLLGLLVPEHPIPHPNPEQGPVALIFMILAPQTKNTMMLQTLAAIARLLKSRETKQAILSVRSAPRLLRWIEDSGIDVKKTLMAGDIMSPITHTVRTDTVLARAVDVLVDAPDEGIPVLNEQGKLVGELTSRELLRLGMPNYLGLIANPSMLDSFEPFENFFQHENSMTVREICGRDIVTVSPSAPVVQVAHLMMTRQKRRIYVLDEGQLRGIIFRKTIIERVLHL
ncbi:MAG TPA: PTS sugar transporter subunit IIA [Candidatus Sumerlaeota bacterium]|nr:MAG: PTS system 2-O-a-mannosyl-D-glycerate specific transporter subunit IIABC [candidate division BRC1 bacterium ADurb.BinA292]HOE95346.1 PTS sugar transporter subunit IIA [Candidatus Sumerlaeota bacterium]HOR26787.1 PTS sugar transporter subunit IIA [Candidatus Sumerlaeota bacterium]HPK01301.1 PTS sugar transporter subunit IIA [Candidatus Sumerlaeota bacterium]